MPDLLIPAHALGASLALTLGAWQLLRRPRGDRAHRRVGRVWVAAMYWTVLSSFFIRELEPGGFSWIHGLSMLTFVTLTVAVWAAVTGRVELHRRFARGSYLGLVGAFLGAVAVPQRDVPQLLVHRPLLFGLAVLAVVVVTLLVAAPPSLRRVLGGLGWSDQRGKDRDRCATPGLAAPDSRSPSSRSAA